MNRIDSLFARLRAEGRRALMPFITAGDPDLLTTVALIVELVTRGADMVELGVPYSDPIADGPVIAASYHRALENGIKLDAIFRSLGVLRTKSSQTAVTTTPIVTMVSYAIVHRAGTENYLRKAVEAGIDGLIVPDLPLEESEPLFKRVSDVGLKLIQLVTPTTPRERAVQIARTTSGFIYYVSIAGITGERTQIPPELAENVGWLRTQTDLPICIGFGISTPDHIRSLAPVADGLIVGSALVRRLDEGQDQPRTEVVRKIGEYVGTLADAIKEFRVPRQ